MQRKPIYDDVELPFTNPATPSPPKLLPIEPADEEHKPRGPTPTDRVAVQVGRARVFLHKYAAYAETKINETMDSAFHLEQSFTNTVASLAPPQGSGERLMPGAIYVLVAAMAGSIVTRRSNILLRATAPLALGIGAGWVVLPITMRNVSDLTWKYEQRFPAVADSHASMQDGVQKGVHFAQAHGQVGVRYVDEKVTDARQVIEGWVRKGK